MKKVIKPLGMVLIVLLISVNLNAQDVSVYNKKFGLDFDQVLENVDNIGNFDQKDFSSDMTIVSQKPGEEDEVLVTKVLRRDYDDKFALIILAPQAQKGQGYLQIGDNVWFYDPGSRKFEHSSMKENIQNSDAKNSDINRSSLAKDYNIIKVQDVMLGKYPTWKITLDAKTENVSYKKVELWVTKKGSLALKANEYGFSGKLMRTTAYTKYKKIDNKYIPTKIFIRDQLNIGENSELTMSNLSVASLKDSTFSKAFLENVSK